MRKRVRWWFIAPALAACCVVVWALVIHNYEPKVRRIAQKRIEAYFRAEFHSSVEISGLQVTSVFPRVHITIHDVVLRQYGEPTAPPVLQMQRVTFETKVASLLSHRPVIGTVWLDGLQIRIAPRPQGSRPLIQPRDAELAK